MNLFRPRPKSRPWLRRPFGEPDRIRLPRYRRNPVLSSGILDIFMPGLTLSALFFLGIMMWNGWRWLMSWFS